jgi:Putative Se/S carrier protein-like
MSPLGFLRKSQPEVEQREKADSGFLVFENTSEVIQAENLLKKKGWEIRVMGPPPEVRSGCDLVIEFPLIEELKITKVLQDAGIPPLQAVPVTGPLLQPVDLFKTKDFDKHLMVQAANMKLTIDKESLLIVNVSGGGWPDVPYLAEQMVGKHLNEAPSPREIGHTLCGYALQLAYEEIQRRCSQS